MTSPFRNECALVNAATRDKGTAHDRCGRNDADLLQLAITEGKPKDADQIHAASNIC